MKQTIAEAILHAQIVLLTIFGCFGFVGFFWLLYQMITNRKEHDE